VSTPPFFLVEALPDGARAVLDGPEGRHAATVKRLRPGEAVLLGDGRGGLAYAVVAAVARDVVTCEITDRSTVPPPSPRIVLAQALVKGERGELAVELATEAGVDAIVPWTAARCVARWAEGLRRDKGLARWRTTVREAAKQARRPWVPSVAEPESTRALAERVAAAFCALVLHEGAALTLADAPIPLAVAPSGLGRAPSDAAPSGGAPSRRGRDGAGRVAGVDRPDGESAGRDGAGGDLLLVVGPEGGITDDELGALTAAGATAVRLGPEVLRASTAAAVALGALGVLTGRWAALPPPTAAG
jgi:16S rRNA (uracil1498-N3)-methyltransferase